MTAPWGPSVHLSRELFVTTDYLLLHFFSSDRRLILAFLQPSFSFFFHPSIYLSIIIPSLATLWEPIRSTISPQAVAELWHEDTGSQCPQIPAVSILDSLSEIIRTFISFRKHGCVHYLLGESVPIIGVRRLRDSLPQTSLAGI